MKAITSSIFTFLTVCTLSTACNNGNPPTSTEKANDTVATTDTIVTPIEEPEAEKPAYTSDDRKAFGLKGNVKDVTPYASAEWNILEKLKFDEQGNWKKPGGTTKALNADGFLKTLSTSGGDQSIKVTYTDYDENGNPTKLTVKAEDSFGETTYKETYTYTDFDTEGNWTKCTVKFSRTFLNWDTDAEEKTQGKATLKRTIHYY